MHGVRLQEEVARCGFSGDFKVEVKEPFTRIRDSPCVYTKPFSLMMLPKQKAPQGGFLKNMLSRQIWLWTENDLFWIPWCHTSKSHTQPWNRTTASNNDDHIGQRPYYHNQNTAPVSWSRVAYKVTMNTKSVFKTSRFTFLFMSLESANGDTEETYRL